MKFLLSLLLILSLVGCSGGKSLEEVADGAGIDVPDQDEFEEDFAEEAGEAIADAQSDVQDNVDTAFGVESDDEGADEFASDDEGFGDDSDGFSEGGDEFASDDTSTDDSMVSGFSDGGTGMEATTGDTRAMAMTDTSSGTYTVKSGDTLMLIAFKIYGDYDQWRTLANMNSGKLGPRYTVSAGTVLNFNPPAQEFVWNPSGNPYLIQVGDTLGTISSTTYGTSKYWRAIWKNNTPLIKDPNKIFAGFTIYTPMLNDRGLANEDM